MVHKHAPGSDRDGLAKLRDGFWQQVMQAIGKQSANAEQTLYIFVPCLGICAPCI